MKISYRTAGAGGYTLLGDESDRTQSIADYEPEMTGLAQTSPMFGSATQLVAALGNRLWTMRVVIDRTHDSKDDTLDFLASHPLSLPDALDVKFEGKAKTTYLTGAVITGFKGKQRGESSTCTYVFVGNYTPAAPGISSDASDPPA